jgi:hypothetical protein
MVVMMIIINQFYSYLGYLERVLVCYRETLKYIINVTKLNSVALVRKGTIQTEQPPLVGEVSATFRG